MLACVYLSVFVACVFVCVRVYAYWILVLWSDTFTSVLLQE